MIEKKVFRLSQGETFSNFDSCLWLEMAGGNERLQI
jgi:hypothetical protein